MGLKLKIILGYAILIALLAVTICLFRREQIKRNTLLRNERELVHTWQLTEQIYADLLELATGRRNGQRLEAGRLSFIQ